jgi:hypothetical protein
VARAPVDHGEDAWQGGGGGSSLVRWLDGNGRRATGTMVLDNGGAAAVVADDGRGLLQNRGGEGDVRRYLNWKERGPRSALTGEASR